MKKLAILASALTAGIFTTAQADVSVSGASTIAYQSADGQNHSAHGGSVDFAMSTTTDSGMSVSTSAGISLSASDTDDTRTVTGFKNITWATGGVSITTGTDVGLPDGVGRVGELASDLTALGNNGVSKSTGLTDDEGVGISLATSFGGASVSLYYVYDSAARTAMGDIDGATGTGSGVKIATTVGDVGLTAAYAAHADTSIDDTESAIAASYSSDMGDITVGYTSSTGALDGTSIALKYSLSLDDATTVAFGYNSYAVNSLDAKRTDVTLSRSLGGGVSVFGQLMSVSGDTAVDTTTTSDSTMSIGTSLSF